MTERVRRLATSTVLLPLLFLPLALSLAACGDTLVDHRNIKIRDQVQPIACQGVDQLVCSVAGVDTCKDQGVGPDKVCGSSCQPCVEPGPANSTRACLPTADGQDRFCDFACAGGYLKVAGGCSVPNHVAAGDQFTCATAASTGEVFCWGWNANGQLGDPALSLAPRQKAAKVPSVSLVGVLDLAAGPSHACAIVPGAPKKVFCWGDAAGFGGNQSSAVPVEVPALAGMDRLTAGGGHTCGWTQAGGLACTGAATAGGGAPNLGGTVLEVAAGHFFSCALVFVPGTGPGSGTLVKCWGQNDKGQLGDLGAAGTIGTPLTVGFPGGAPPANDLIRHVAAGAAHACAATTLDGAAQGPSFFCWGDNTGNQGGINAAGAGPIIGPSTIKINKPASGDAPRTIEAGGITTCVTALDPTNALKCWGADGVANGGGLIPGEKVDLTNLSPPGVFSVGADHACIVNQVTGPAFGLLQCWGHNAQGQLGNGAFADSSAPVLVLSQ